MLAGGRSRRYGSDKLAADLAGAPLLDRAVAGLAPGRQVIIVGPDRPVGRLVRFVPDDHPGGGPAAAMITGLRAALATAAELITVLPGDAPGGGAAAEALLTRLAREPTATGLLAVDPDGRQQPLQFAIRRGAAVRLIEAAGPDGGDGASARRLVLPLGLLPVALAGAQTWDIDTPEQHRAWVWRDSPAVRQILAAIGTRTPAPVILLGTDSAGLTALAQALILARPGLLADPVIAPAGDGWATVLLRPSSPPRPGAAAFRIALRSPGDTVPDPAGVDLWVPHPDD